MGAATGSLRLARATALAAAAEAIRLRR